MFHCLFLLTGSVPTQLPEHPDKKAVVRKQRQQMKDFLRFVAGDQQLRNCQLFVDFLMPDDQEFGGSVTDGGSEVVSYCCTIVYTVCST